jgi:hypothetical protein
MSNRREAVFINGIFCMQSFWKGHGEILPKNLIYAGRSSLPSFSRIQQPGWVSIVVTPDQLTIWSRKMNHLKAERVTYGDGIQ